MIDGRAGPMRSLSSGAISFLPSHSSVRVVTGLYTAIGRSLRRDRVRRRAEIVTSASTTRRRAVGRMVGVEAAMWRG